MALDEPLENDSTFAEQDITFVIENGLLERAKPIRLDFVDAAGRAGFKFTSSLLTSDCGCS
jgi:Fe-S cluster assembly iron-binding protein IscA